MIIDKFIVLTHSKDVDLNLPYLLNNNLILIVFEIFQVEAREHVFHIFYIIPSYEAFLDQLGSLRYQLHDLTRV